MTKTAFKVRPFGYYVLPAEAYPLGVIMTFVLFEVGCLKQVRLMWLRDGFIALCKTDFDVARLSFFFNGTLKTMCPNTMFYFFSW